MKKKLMILVSACLLSTSQADAGFSFASLTPSRTTLFAAIAGAAMAYTSVTVVKKVSNSARQVLSSVANFVQKHAIEIGVIAGGALLAAIFKEEIFGIIQEEFKHDKPSVAPNPQPVAAASAMQNLLSEPKKS